MSLFNCHIKWPNREMDSDFNDIRESKLLKFVQDNYGFEVFTPGLDRTHPIFLPFVDIVQVQKVKVIIIAGTNGKGQTAHTLSHLFEKSDLEVALWTSPHIISLKERFKINGKDLSYDELENEIYQTHEFLKQNHSKLIVSFYEFLFLVFLRKMFFPSGSSFVK